MIVCPTLLGQYQNQDLFKKVLAFFDKVSQNFPIRKSARLLSLLFLIITVAAQRLILAMFAQHHAAITVDDAV